MPPPPALARRWPRPLRGRSSAVLQALADLAILVVMLALASLHGLPDTGVLLLLLGSWLVLLARFRHPVAVLVLTVAADAARLGLHQLEPPATFTVLPVATLVAVATVAASRRATIAWPAGLSAALVLLVVGLVRQQLDHEAELMFMADVVVVATTAGYLARLRRRRFAQAVERAELAERDSEAQARRQVAAERVRIARELHDMLAHHLTLVNAQAGVAEHLLRSDPETAAVALRGIGANTRQALDEVKVTIGLLRQALDGAAAGDDQPLRPAPTVADLTELVTAFRDAGGRLTVEVTGEPAALPAATDLAGYRIVQESLTNARKHAPGAPVELLLRWTGAALEVRVRNAVGRPVEAAVDAPGGHGLIGMRERALAAGGTLRAGPAAGGFEVHAVLPLRAADLLVAGAGGAR